MMQLKQNFAVKIGRDLKMYNSLLSFGDIIELKIEIDPKRLLRDVKDNKWYRYNPSKSSERYGMSITTLDGETGQTPDLDSIYEYNRINGTSYDESSFKTFTKTYYDSIDLQYAIEPFKESIARTHLLKLPAGGYFPPHRDIAIIDKNIDRQAHFRLVVPIQNCNPSDMYFMFEDKPVYFNHGSMYFMNTNKSHNVFSYINDSIMLIMNVECNKQSLSKVVETMRWK